MTFFPNILRMCLTACVAIVLLSLHGKPKTYLITSFGAKGDSSTNNTRAIQKTIDACAQNGGGLVVVPKGVFISGSIFLKQGVDLRIEKDAVLKGSVDSADYPYMKTRWEGTEMMFVAALVNADSLSGVHISGEGTIDGSGDLWLQKIRNAKGARNWYRPRLIGIQHCSNVNLSNLKLHNQAVWCVHILYCENVVLENLNITADHNIPSSDGIDIDSSKKVTVHKCYIDVNDDCISIKSGKDEDGLRVNRASEDIVIDNCTFGYGHGGVAMGSETSGGIRNVVINNCIAETGNWAPIRFKSQPSRGGVVENIIYRNFTLKNTKKAVEFNMAWRMVPPVKPAAKVLPVVRNVQLINITGTVEAIGDMHGLEGSPIQGILFKNCSLIAEKGLLIEHASDIDLSGLKATVKTGEVVTLKDAQVIKGGE